MEYNQLKKVLGDWFAEILTIGISSKVPKKKTFPYLHYYLGSSSNTVRLRDDYILTCDFWDDTEDTTVIGAQSELVKAALNYGWYSDVNGYFQSHIIFNSEVPEPTPNMARHQQRYLLKVR